MALSVGTRLGAYEITALIGAGSMGEVYRARDTRLDRTVAIKVLAATLGGDPQLRARLQREAETVSKLDHPHICQLHDIGTEGELFYLVMQYLDGESLAARLAKGPLPVRDALTAAIQIAEALHAAHSAGIVHRDLKPANVVLTRTGAKLLDFGVARMVGPSAESLTTGIATAPGAIVGTPAYLSPEQARGEPGDRRADIFAFGLLLYEMLSGARAIRGDSWIDALTSLMRDPAPDVRRALPHVPTAAAETLHATIGRCLEKQSEHRYAAFPEVIRELRKVDDLLQRAAAPPELDAVPSLVVLPFEDLSAAKDNEYFTDGLTDETITALSKLRGLRVISRASAATFKGSRFTTREIGLTLRVQYVMQGSVRRAGNDLRITAQLVEAANDSHVWADRYSGTLDDVFLIQEQVARSIVEALQLKLTPVEQQSLAQRPLDDVRAFECYLQAQHESRNFSAASFARAIGHLQHGLNLVGEHPVLLAGLANAHLNALECGLESREQAIAPARDVANRLLTMDSRHGHAVLAKLERATGTQLQAIPRFEQAVAENPADVDAYFWLILSYAIHAGQPKAARAAYRRLMSIDPLTVSNNVALGWIHMSEGDPAGALGVFEDMWRRSPELRVAKFMSLLSLTWLDRRDDAVRLADEIISADSSDMFAAAAGAVKAAITKDKDALRAILHGPFHDYFWHDSEWPWWVAGLLAVVGERQLALDWLQRAVDRGWFNFPVMDGIDPLLDPLRDEPRFRELHAAVRTRWKAFAPRNIHQP